MANSEKDVGSPQSSANLRPSDVSILERQAV